VYPLIYQGKVRDVYQVDNDRLLMVASDRISAFDHVFTEIIPNKGKVLTAMTAFWNDILQNKFQTHLISTDHRDFGLSSDQIEKFSLKGRSMLVKKAVMLPIECIVRGYIAGSAWNEYRTTSTMHGLRLPPGLKQGAKLDHPFFTPSTKNKLGHDENISTAQAKELLGTDLFDQVESLCISAYQIAADVALTKGIIIADTKFEIGLIDGELAVCDEILTPDSSRFWSLDDYENNLIQVSFDKQPIRDWAEKTGWDKISEPPPLPQEVIDRSLDRYIYAYERLSSKNFSDWSGEK